MRVEGLEVMVPSSLITTVHDPIAPIGILLKTVFESILEVFLLCLVGYVLARQGILDKRTQKQLNRLNVSFFPPSLLFSKVAFFLSPDISNWSHFNTIGLTSSIPSSFTEVTVTTFSTHFPYLAKLQELWTLPIFFSVVTAVSMVVAIVLSRLYGLKKSQTSFAKAASMFMNSNSLPIAIMQSLVVTVPILRWGDDDNTVSMLGRSLTYFVVYSTLGMVLRWSYGVHLLSQTDLADANARHTSENEDAIAGSAEPEAEYSPLLSNEGAGSVECRSGHTASTPFENTAVHNETRGFYTDPSVQHEDTLHAGRGHADAWQVFYYFPNTPTRLLPRLSSIFSHTSHSPDGKVGDTEVNHVLPGPAIGDPRGHLGFETVSTLLQSTLRRLKVRVKGVFLTFNAFMTIPLWAAVASIIVALIQPLQHVLSVHVPWIKGALTAAGDCSIPITLVVLGAYFHTPPEKPSSGMAIDQGETMDGESANATARRPGAIETNGYGSCLSTQRSKSADKATTQNAPRPGETRTVAISVASRMLFTPLVLFPIIWQVSKTGLFPLFDDPIFVMSNVLFVSSPPALTLAQISQAASGDAFERVLSRTIFWSYCVVTPPVTIIYIILGLVLVRL